MNYFKSTFQDKTTPVLVIESFYPRENQEPKRNFSGMGFLYKKNPDDTYIFVTCGHFFWPEIFNTPKGSDLFITKDFGTNKNPAESNFLPFKILAGPLFSKNNNEDISIFSVIPSRKPLNDFKLFSISKSLENLEDAGCVSLSMINEQSVIDLIYQESSKKLPYNKYNFKSIQAALAKKDTKSALELIKFGACEYPCYEIFSDFGASGSPIWTKDGNLLGMNLGGQTGAWTAVATTKQIDSVVNELGL